MAADYTGSFSGSFTGSYDILTNTDQYNGTTYGYVLHQRVGTNKAENILLSDFFRDWLGSESGSAGIQNYGAYGHIFDGDRILIRSGSYSGSSFRPILKTATISNLFGGYSNGTLRNTFIYARGVGRNTEASPTISSSMVLTVGGQILYEDNDGVGDLHGLTLTILEATDFSKVSTTRYNTALGGSTAAANDLGAAISDMSPTEIGIITSLGHWEIYLTNTLRTAAKKVGLSKLGGYVSTDSGSAYAAVFYGTSGSAGVSDSLERLVAYRFTTGSNLDIPTATITTRVQSNTHGIYPFVNISDASSTNALYRYSANTASVTEPALLVNSDGEIESLGDVVTFKSDTATITLDMSSSSDTFLFVDGYVSTSGHIVPSATELYDLGSTDLRWRDLYLSGSTIYLGNAQISSVGQYVSASFTGSFKGDGSQLTNLPGGGGATPGGVNTEIQYNDGGTLNGATDFVWDAGKVGIGTASPSSYNSTADNLVIYAADGFPGITLASGAGVGNPGSYATIVFADGTTGTDEYTGYIRYFLDTETYGFYGNAGAHKMTISGSGNVGIGTASPDGNLHILGTTNATAIIEATANNDATLKLLEAGTGDVGAAFVYDGGDNKLYIQAGNNPPVTRMTIQRDDGNVGIGTTGPQSKLQVDSDTPLVLYGSANDIRLNFDLPNFAYATINARNKADSSNRDLTLQTDGGNVGIGTTNPTASLHVVGVGYFQADGAQFGSADLVTNAAIVIPEHDFIYTEDGTPGSGNLRKLIGKSGSADIIQIGQPGTSLIDEIRFYPGTTWDGTRGFTSFYNSTTEVARFTGDGLGIGTTSPDFKLDVIGSGSFEELLRVTRAGTAQYVDIDVDGPEFPTATGISSYSTTTNAKSLIIRATTDTSHTANTAGNIALDFRTFNTTRMYVSQSSGGPRVGIGNTTPSYALDVTGDIRATTNMYVASALIHDGDADTYMQFNAEDTWRVLTGNSERIRATNAGIIINENSNSTTDFRVESDAASHMLFVDAGSNEVGINNSAPGATLDVNGTFRTSGVATLDDAFVFTSSSDGTGPFSRMSTSGEVFPAIILDGFNDGDNWDSQGAQISLGENVSMRTGGTGLHLTYTGNGYGYIGMGTITSGVPAFSTLRFDYNSDWIQASTHMQFTDNYSASFGTRTTGDLTIYHNASNSYIDNKTGHLYIRNNVDDDDGSNIYIQAKSGENGIIVNDDGAVDLYYNNAAKLSTTSTGLNVTGNITASGNIRLSTNGGRIVGGEANDYIYFDNATDEFRLVTDNVQVFAADSTAGLVIGAYDLVVDTDTLFVDAGTDRVGINDNTPSYSLDVNGTFRTTGNAILGDGTGDAHTVNGSLSGVGWSVTNAGNSTFVNVSSDEAYNTNTNAAGRVKYNVYGSGGTYGIGMQSARTHGGLGDWAMTFQMNDDDDRGWLWCDGSNLDAEDGAMSLTTNGKASLAHSMMIGYGETNTTTPGATYRLDVSGTIRATTDVVVTSDIRLKNELPDTVQGLETVDKLRPIKYTLKDDEDENPKIHLGFSAQELLDIVPEVVRQGDDDYYSVAYQKLVPVLVKAIQELTEEVRELKKKVEE